MSNRTLRILLLLCLFLWPLDSLHASQIAHYSFDGTAEDVSGNGNHGVVVSGVFRQGKVGQAIDLDGVNDYVSVSSNPQIGLDGLSQASWAAWIFPRSLGQSSQGRIFDKGGGSSISSGYAISLRSDSAIVVQINRNTGSDPLAQSSSGFVTLNTWQHIAVVFGSSPGTFEFYKD